MPGPFDQDDQLRMRSVTPEGERLLCYGVSSVVSQCARRVPHALTLRPSSNFGDGVPGSMIRSPRSRTRSAEHPRGRWTPRSWAPRRMITDGQGKDGRPSNRHHDLHLGHQFTPGASRRRIVRAESASRFLSPCRANVPEGAVFRCPSPIYRPVAGSHDEIPERCSRYRPVVMVATPREHCQARDTSTVLRRFDGSEGRGCCPERTFARPTTK